MHVVRYIELKKPRKEKRESILNSKCLQNKLPYQSNLQHVNILNFYT